VEGLKVTASATQKNAAAEPTGSVKTTFDFMKNASLETEAALPTGKVTATASHSGLVKGMKLTVSGDPKHLPSAKIALQVLRNAIGVKCDLTNVTGGAPKADVNACYSSGDVAVGAAANVDCKTGAVSNYSLAAQLIAEDTTLGVIASDQLDTLKGSVALKIDETTAAAAEVTYKVKAKSCDVSLAVSKKFSDFCSGKVAISSAVPINGTGQIDPVVAVYTTGDIAAKTTGSLSVRTDAALNAQWGAQIAVKI
jgi:hypothetical protein